MRLLALFLCSNLFGCAAIISGSHESVKIESSQLGSSVVVDGTSYATPATIELSRKATHTVTFPDGQTVEIQRGFNGVTLLNLLLGGIIGLAIDGFGGYLMGDLHPDHIRWENGKLVNARTGKPLTKPATPPQAKPASPRP